MELPPDLRTAFLELLDPFHYVREADLALLDGDREQAEALIVQAYLAFDLVIADCANFTGKVRSGRNS